MDTVEKVSWLGEHLETLNFPDLSVKIQVHKKGIFPREPFKSFYSHDIPRLVETLWTAHAIVEKNWANEQFNDLKAALERDRPGFFFSTGSSSTSGVLSIMSKHANTPAGTLKHDTIGVVYSPYAMQITPQQLAELLEAAIPD